MSACQAFFGLAGKATEMSITMERLGVRQKKVGAKNKPHGPPLQGAMRLCK